MNSLFSIKNKENECQQQFNSSLYVFLFNFMFLSKLHSHFKKWIMYPYPHQNKVKFNSSKVNSDQLSSLDGQSEQFTGLQFVS